VGKHDFTLKFSLRTGADPEAYVDRLYEAGCDDALVGIGRRGSIGLMFTREATSASDAVHSAIRDVKKAIPNAMLTEATPDFVGATDVADLVGCSRQNMRKLMLNCREGAPVPVHEGTPSVWHLAHVLRWLRDKKQYRISGELLDLAETTMRLNVAVELRNSDKATQREMQALVG
jgi:hypothetical protein